MKEAAILTTVPASTSTTTTTTVFPNSLPLYTKNVHTKPLCPLKELPNNNKRNSNVLSECAPDPPKSEMVGEAEIMELRSPQTHKPNSHYIVAANINSRHCCNNLIGYLKPSGTPNHVRHSNFD